MKIVMLDAHTANPGDVSWAPFEAIAPCEFHPRTPVAETVARCAGAPIVITNKAPMTRQIIESLPDLKYIGVIATGFNIVDTVAAKERGVIVTNVPGYGTPAVAQHVFALILELANNVGASAQSVAAGGWQRCPDFCYYDKPIIELAGRTLGIIGYGEIGAAVARIGQAFGMKVLASKRNWSGGPPAGIGAADTDTIFREADVISLHCPLTDATKHLVNERTLGLMKKSALLINTGRGPLIDDQALAAALEAGTIAGAGVDVLSMEPPKDGNPLLNAKNCLVTPHVAWASREARLRLIDACAANVKAFLAGSPVNVVNP
ncbi:MAG: D-2-hydroxyacid dehydrogenase [Verrucomicrobiaceae bacterium]|nr:D-2-hydroxyacid dehydrogenase [Verrucomicrobiaceae bacterium]